MVFLFSSISFKSIGADVALADEKPTKEFKMYPNPVLDAKFTIDSNEEIVEVKVLNLLGQQVFQNFFPSESSVKIELDTQEKGLYLVQIKTKDNRVTTKRILFK